MLVQSTSGNHYLTFDEEKHTYVLDGELIDGVTSINHNGFPESPILSSWKIKEGSKYTIEQLALCPEQASRLPKYLLDEIIKKSTQAYKKAAKEAADIGTIVHDYCEATESGQTYLVDMQHPDIEKIERCIAKFAKWRLENDDRIIGHEEIIASPVHKFAGRFDRLAKRGDLVVLSDFKTSTGIYSSYWVQLGAYVLALKEWKDIEVDAIEIVRFGKENGEFETELVKSKKQIKEFQDQFIRNLETYNFIRRCKS